MPHRKFLVFRLSQMACGGPLVGFEGELVLSGYTNCLWGGEPRAETLMSIILISGVSPLALVLEHLLLLWRDLLVLEMAPLNL